MIVKESINFERGINPKEALGVGTYIPGRLFKWPDKLSHRPEFPNVYMFTGIFEKKWRLYFYIGRFINPQNSLFGAEFTFSEKLESDMSWNMQPMKDDKFVPISPEEETKLQKVFSDPDNENLLSRLEKSAKKRPVLKESVNFQRGGEETDIKNKIFGFRPGQIVKRQLPNDPNNKELFVFLGWEDSRGSAINLQGYEIGYLRPPIYAITAKGNELKRPAFAILRPKDYPVLTNDIFLHQLDSEERELVQVALKNPENKMHLEKITEIITSDITPFV
jgi:hypothetical protein